MAAVAPLETPEAPLHQSDQRMLLSVSWKEYVILRELLDRPGLRMTYLKGALELTSPAPPHELWKKNIARLVELYAHIKRIDLHGYGSTTFKAEVKERGAEPDECYLIGKTLTEYPEIVLEVINTAPLLNKLDVYAGFAIPEVWVFRDAKFTIHWFDGETGRYRPSMSSALLPGLDFEALARYAMREDTPQALREFEAAIR
jgi:Uma2 family endonuclease